MARDIPTPDGETSWHALQALLRERHPYAAVEIFHRALGDVFRITLPGFRPIFMAGPHAARFVLVEARESFNWRNENDPVTELLDHGMLVVDGEEHDHLRGLMNPALSRRRVDGYLDIMLRRTDEITVGWADGATVDMLVEMRKITLLALMEALFDVDLAPELDRLWGPVLSAIRYVSPGLWMLWRGVPRPQFDGRIRQLDEYLFRIIAERRERLERDSEAGDLLSVLIQAGLPDRRVRDQMLTMLIAGHDTNTALLAWALALLGQHPEALARSTAEVRATLGEARPEIEGINQLEYVALVLKEALRLYPPIHLGSRVAAADLEFNGYPIPRGERVVYSIYLTQRDPAYWDEPARFIPERHTGRSAPYTWIPFGGGPRNCIGSAFGMLEAKVVLARVLQQFDVELVEPAIRPRMAATLEPQPGVRMRGGRV